MTIVLADAVTMWQTPDRLLPEKCAPTLGAAITATTTRTKNAKATCLTLKVIVLSSVFVESRSLSLHASISP